MKGPYVIRRKPARNSAFAYSWLLVDTRKIDHVVTSMNNNNPICAPEALRRRQSLLNTRVILDGEG